MDQLDNLFLIVAAVLIGLVALAIAWSLWCFHRLCTPSSRRELNRLRTYYSGQSLNPPQPSSSVQQDNGLLSYLQWMQRGRLSKKLFASK